MKYQLLEHVSLTEVDDEAVLLDLNSGAYYGLNHVGALLLKFFETNMTVDIAIEQIAERYQTSPAQVQDDIESLIQQLLEQQLIAALDPS